MKSRFVIVVLVALTCINLWALSRWSSTAAAQAAQDMPSIHHILLEVKDLERAVKFYRDEMGLKINSKSGDFATLDSANVGVRTFDQLAGTPAV